MKTGAHGDSNRPGGRTVRLNTGATTLVGELEVPSGAIGIVLFAHGSGSSRHSPRNQQVGRFIRQSGTATLLLDLLTQEEEASGDRDLVFNITLLAQRLLDATRWIARQPETQRLGVGYFGASTGAAAALIAAAELGPALDAIVSRGGRPDLAKDALPRVDAPTLLIVGEKDEPVLAWNRDSYDRLTCTKEFRVIPNASHLFEEAGALEEVARLASQWFLRHLRPR